MREKLIEKMLLHFYTSKVGLFISCKEISHRYIASQTIADGDIGFEFNVLLFGKTTVFITSFSIKKYF